ncbi:MAG: flavodoxin domain-containing protein [Tenuifilaceae bacterium]
MRTIVIIIVFVFSTACKTKPQETVIENRNMKTLIVYASSHGTTEKVANIIKEKLDSTTVQTINLKSKAKVDLSNFETVIIGGSIHAGSIQSEVKNFIKENTITLMEKKVALYLCCMNEKEEQTEFNNNFPELLRNHSSYNAIVGGEYIFEKMNFIEKFLVRKIAGVSSTISKLRYTEIDNLVNSLK